MNAWLKLYLTGKGSTEGIPLYDQTLSYDELFDYIKTQAEAQTARVDVDKNINWYFAMLIDSCYSGAAIDSLKKLATKELRQEDDPRFKVTGYSYNFKGSGIVNISLFTSC